MVYSVLLFKLIFTIMKFEKQFQAKFISNKNGQDVVKITLPYSSVLCFVFKNNIIPTQYIINLHFYLIKT